MQKIVMLRKVSGEHHIFVPVKSLDANGPVPKSLVVTYFLKQLSFWKAIEGFGYLLAVTKLKSIDNGKIDGMSKVVDFSVAFQCRTFLPVEGEVLVGVVRMVLTTGVFMKCGPANFIYLSVIKMPNYHYVPGEKPHFLSNDLSRIEKDVVVRFKVFATRWNQQRREIDIIASLEGDGLGPVSLAGTEGVHL